MVREQNLVTPELLGIGHGPGPAESLQHVQTVPLFLGKRSLDQVQYGGGTEKGGDLINSGKGVQIEWQPGHQRFLSGDVAFLFLP